MIQVTIIPKYSLQPPRSLLRLGQPKTKVFFDEINKLDNAGIPPSTSALSMLIGFDKTRNLGPHLVSGRREFEPTIRCLGTYPQAARDTVLLRKSNC
jgi:hypothetical protein